MSRPVTDLRNLGPRCAEWLAVIGIHDEEALREVGAVAAYRELVIQDVVKPHKMLLYALAGAVDGVDCLKLTPERKRELADEAGV